jgi:hypothetical protein
MGYFNIYFSVFECISCHLNEACFDVKMIKSLNDNILPKQSILETCKIMKVSILPTRARHRERIKKKERN